MIDRFGLLPDEIKQLFSQAEVRIHARELGIAEIDVAAAGGSIEFTDNTRVEPLSLVKLIQSDPKTYQLAGANKLRWKRELPSLADRKGFIEDLLAGFSKDIAETKAA